MAKIFLSYARVDGTELAERLERDLREKSVHEPWRDRSEIQAGHDWARQIEQAIDQSHVLIAILTPGSYRSEICRGEQERALRMLKLVIPLLAQKDADRPVYLEAWDYLDFTNLNQYDANFRDLLTNIKSSNGVSWDQLAPRFRGRLSEQVPIDASGALLRGRQPSWREVCTLAYTHRARFLEALAPRPGAVGIFEPAIYTPRVELDHELDDFIAGTALAFVVVGEPGIGKTNLLCDWSRREESNDHAVLAYHCDRLDSESAEYELMNDFGVDDPAEFALELRKLDELAQQAGKQLIVIFDAINDFRSTGKEGNPLQLLNSIDSLVAHLPGNNLRVVFSCSTATWDRFERLGPLRLTWQRYYRNTSEEVAIALKRFNEHEAGTAFDAYRRYFGLTFALSDLPIALQIRIREPLMLRLLAETYRGASDPGALPAFDALVFSRYYDERVRRRDDRHFVDLLVEEMMAQETAAPAIESLSNHPLLGPEVLSEAADGSYSRLLDLGVLLEMPGDLFQDTVVRFTYPLVGAYALARQLSRNAQPLTQTLHELLAKADRFSFAWDTAVTLLMLRGDMAVYSELAGAANPEQRELASASLVKLRNLDHDRAGEILNQLFDSKVEELQRTAVRAAFTIGPDARELLLRGAMSESQTLQRAVKDTLFLIWSGVSRSGSRPDTSTIYFLWRHAQEFTHEMLHDLVERVSWLRPQESIRITRFILDWCITLYINHCDRSDVAEQIAELLHELFANRLHFDRFNLGSRVDRAMLRIVASVFARPILEWTLMEDPQQFFQRPASTRRMLAEAAQLVDPAKDIAPAADLIQNMLNSKISALQGTAALVLGVHSCADFARYEALHRRLFGALDDPGRLWQLLGFSVLLRETPVAWIGLLEDMTQRMLVSDSLSTSGPAELLGAGDLVLVPLGLAYGKRGDGMPLFDALLATATSTTHLDDAAHLVSCLGPVGFYYPESVLGVLEPHLNALAEQQVTREAILSALATIRTLHFDLVDAFMFRNGLDESFHRKLAAVTDVQRINRFMLTIGLYNNAIHQCLHYPRMRRWLTMFPLQRLAEANSASEVVTDYAARILLMVREANFDLLQLTLPEQQ